MLFGGTVVGNFLDAFRLRDAVHPPSVDADKLRFVITIKRGLREH